MEETNEKLRQWHPAFCSAIRLELREQKHGLDYINEYTLNSKPILIDLLVIKKARDLSIGNEIGRLFRGHNIMEFKSPDDDLNVDTYYKVLAYACLYKSQGDRVDSIAADDITVSLVRERKPYKLFRFFRRKNYIIENIYPGIYYIKKDGFFDTQIIVSKELNEKNHVWLKALASGMKDEQIRSLLLNMNTLDEKDDKEFADSVLSLAMQTNTKQFEHLKREDFVMCKELWELMKPEIEEALNQSIEEGLQKGHLKGLREGQLKGLQEGQLRGKAEAYHDVGLSLSEIAGKLNIPIEKVQEILDKTEQ